MLDYAGRLPSAQSEIFIASLGGAINRVPAEATAYPHRDVSYVMNVHTRWEDPGEDETCVTWARDFSQAMEKFATGGVYVNFVSDGEERVKGAFGINHDRMAALKAKYDARNLFRVNQNVAPSS